MKKASKKPMTKTKRALLIVIGVLLLAAIGFGVKFAYNVTHPDSAFDLDQPAPTDQVVDVPEDSAETRERGIDRHAYADHRPGCASRAAS